MPWYPSIYNSITIISFYKPFFKFTFKVNQRVYLIMDPSSHFCHSSGRPVKVPVASSTPTWHWCFTFVGPDIVSLETAFSEPDEFSLDFLSPVVNLINLWNKDILLLCKDSIRQFNPGEFGIELMAALGLGSCRRQLQKQDTFGILSA